MVTTKSRSEVDALCKEHGFPTVTEQEEHWKRKDKVEAFVKEMDLDLLLIALKERDERFLTALEGILQTMERMNDNIRLISSRL